MRFARQGTATLAGVSTKLLDPNPNRVSLLFSPPAAGRYSIAFNEDAVHTGHLTIAASTQAIWVTKEMYGELIRGVVNGIASGAGTQFAWVETLEFPDTFEAPL